MNGYQNTVLWIGLALIALNVALEWGNIRPVLFAHQANTIQNVSLTQSGKQSNLIAIPIAFSATPNQNLTFV